MCYVYCCGGAFSGIFALFVIFGLAMAVDFIQKHWIFFVAIPGAVVGIFLLFLLVKFIKFIIDSIKDEIEFKRYCRENFHIIATDRHGY